MDHRGTVGRIYKEEHYILLHTKYESSGPCGFGEEDFFCFTHDPPPPPQKKKNTQNMRALGLVVSEKKIFFIFSSLRPWGGARMDPRGTVGRIYKEDHYTLLLTKYESSGPCGFEEDFFYVFTIVSLWELMTPGAGPFLTPGA